MSAPHDYPSALHPGGAAPPAYQAYHLDTKQPSVSEQPVNQQQQQQNLQSQPQYGQQNHYSQPQQQHQQHQGGAQALPQGWIAQWSQQHNASFYVYTPTGLTQWDVPKPPPSPNHTPPPNQSFPPPPPVAPQEINNETSQNQSHGPAMAVGPIGEPGQPGQPAPHGQYPSTSQPPQFGTAGQPVQFNQQQPSYNQGMSPQHGAPDGGMPGPDGERGLGKAALLVGGGLLAAASFGPFKNKLGKYFGNKPPSGHQGGYPQQGGYPPSQQQQSYGYGVPPPPPGQYHAVNGPQQPTYSGGGIPPPMSGPMNPVGGGAPGVPPLYIHAATFADKDITQLVRTRITRDQSLEFKGKELKNQFSDPWPGAERKSFIVLYQYGDRPMEVLAADDQDELIEIKHGPISKKRMDFCQPPPARIVCCLWGVANATSYVLDAPVKTAPGVHLTDKEKDHELIVSRRAANSQQLETAGEMEASQETLGDGDWYSWEHRTLNCFYRDDQGNITTASVRQGGTLRMPWNPLAKWS